MASMSHAAKVVMGVVVLLPTLYVGSCSVVEHQHEEAFAQVKEGDTERKVIAVLGEPADRETPSHRIASYGSPECTSPCAQRLWYPNRMGLMGEAWAIELDGEGKVVHTAHLTSP